MVTQEVFGTCMFQTKPSLFGEDSVHCEMQEIKFFLIFFFFSFSSPSFKQLTAGLSRGIFCDVLIIFRHITAGSAPGFSWSRNFVCSFVFVYDETLPRFHEVLCFVYIKFHCPPLSGQYPWLH